MSLAVGLMADVMSVFNDLFRRYDDWYLRMRNIWFSECLCLELLGTYGYVLDVGVGTGVFSECLSSNYLVGTDLAPNPLKLARLRGVESVASDAEYLPFRDSVFDCVVMVATICFLKNPERVLREVRRVIKVGGYLITCFVPRESGWGRYYSILKLRGESPFYKVARFFNVEEVINLLSDTGFRFIECVSTLNSLPNNPPITEYPSRSSCGGGFICIKAVSK